MTNWLSSTDYDPARDRPGRPGRPGAEVTRREQSGQMAGTPRPGGRSAGELRIDAATDRADRRAVVTESVSTVDEAPAPAVDAVRYLIASLQQHEKDTELPSRLGFTSAIAGEGVTFICQTVAAVMAHDLRERVCVIDLNWGDAPEAQKGRRGGKKGQRQGKDNQPDPPAGLADALRRQMTLRDIILETDDPRLTIVSAGAATAAEGQVFARSNELSQIINVLERHNDRLILDLPPLLTSSAAIPLARLADAVGLVVRHGVTSDTQVRTALDRLGGVPTLGVVLNRASSKIPRSLQRRLSSW